MTGLLLILGVGNLLPVNLGPGDGTQRGVMGLAGLAVPVYPRAPGAFFITRRSDLLHLSHLP